VLGTLVWQDQPDTIAAVSCAGPVSPDRTTASSARRAGVWLWLSQMLASLTTAPDHGLPSVPAAWAERQAHQGEPGREHVCRTRRCR
jgi:hypothetical protein